MMKSRLITIIASLGLSLSGCLYVASIEEEEDSLPYINVNALTPTLGVVEVELGDDAPLNITLSSYGDENEGQMLYHRVVMDFRPGGDNRIWATKPQVVDERRQQDIMYQFRPCAMSQSYSGAIQDGHSMDLYLLLSDARFMSDSEIIISREGESRQPFKTTTENRAVWAQWSVVFRGSCPSE